MINCEKFVYLYILILFCIALISCTTNVTITPGVNQGIIDLRDIEDTIPNPVHGIPASMIATTLNIAFTLQCDHAAYPNPVLSNIN